MLVLLLVASCGPHVFDDGSQTLIQDHPVFGTLTYEGCSNTEAKLIVAAMSFIKQSVQDPAYLTCLKDAITVDHKWETPERIVEHSTTSLPVSFKCMDMGDAATADRIQPGDPEHVNINHKTFTERTVKELAGTLIHEIMHNHHFSHPHHVGFAVPNIVDRCVDSNGFKLEPRYDRNVLSDIVPTAHAGGDGEAGDKTATTVARRLECDESEVVRGLAGAVGSSALTRLVPRCGRTTGSKILSGNTYFDVNAPNSSTLFDDSCPAGYALIGVQGRQTETKITRLQGVCAALSSLMSDGSLAKIKNLPERGITYTLPTPGEVLVGELSGPLVTVTPPANFTRFCNNRKVVVGIEVGRAADLHNLALLCDDLPRGVQRPRTELAANGGTDGVSIERHCAGNGVLKGLFGRFSDDDARVVSAGGYCVSMTGRHRIPDAQDYRVHPMGGWSWNWDHKWFSRCNDGQVLVGVTGRATTTRVTRVASLCAPYDLWLAGQAWPTIPVDPDYPEANPVISTGAGNLFIRICPAGEVAVGFHGHEGAEVNGFGLYCAEVESSPTLTQTSKAGGDGGNPADRMRCPLGGPISGLETVISDTDGYPFGFGGWCGRVLGPAVHQNYGYRLEARGLAGTEQMDKCPAGQVLVGVKGRSGGQHNVIHQVQGICQKQGAVNAGQTKVSFLPERGPTISGDSPFDLRCPASEVVHGLDFNYGGAVDSIRLLCAPADLYPGDTVSGKLSAVGAQRIWRVVLDKEQSSLNLKLTGSVGSFKLYMRRGLAPVHPTKYDAKGLTFVPPYTGEMPPGDMVIIDGKITGKKIEAPYTVTGLSPAREGVYYILLHQTKAGEASYTLALTSN